VVHDDDVLGEISGAGALGGKRQDLGGVSGEALLDRDDVHAH